MFKFQMPVGDWSGDGHSECEWFLVESNKPVQNAREAHFACKSVLGFNIEDICADINDCSIREDIITILLKNNIITEKWASKNKEYMNPKLIISLWIKILNFIDPEINLRLVKQKTFETINFYGYDEHGRHLSVPGYGVFLL